jgi:ABC-type transport system substrate-binding protein
MSPNGVERRDELRKQHLTFIVLLVTLAALVATPVQSYLIVSEVNPSGPHVDMITYEIIPDEEDAIAALADDEIDLIGEVLDSTYLEELEEMENVETAISPDNGYIYAIINCQRYPLSLTAFRRALSFALDKNAICEDIVEGIATPLDSCVPKVNPFSVEDELTYHYYDAQVQKAKDILSAAGFADYDEDGTLEAPDQSDFDVKIEPPETSSTTMAIADLMVDALAELDIQAESQPGSAYDYLSRMYDGDFDIVFLAGHKPDFDVDWLGYDYWGDFADEPYINFPRFANASYDSWRDQLLTATEYEDVYEASKEMQKIWVYQSPAIICHETYRLSAYRTDRFLGFKNDALEGIPGFWTSYEAYLKESEGGPSGGTLRWSIPGDVASFNYLETQYKSSVDILNMLHDSLFKRDWNGEDIMWLATDCDALTHEDDASIPEGYMQFRFDIIQNATWTDGEPLDAEDIAFSLNYFHDSPNHPNRAYLTEMESATAPSSSNLIVEFSTESYWNLHNIVYMPIIPEQVFEPLGLSGWANWNPYPPDKEMITSGPFNVSRYSSEEFCELSKNPNYFYESEQPVTTTTPTANGEPLPPDTFTMLIAVGAVAAAAVVIGVIVKTRRG